jgi:hypothetical protein
LVLRGHGLGRLLSYQGLRYVPNIDTPTINWSVQQPQTYNPYPPTHPHQDENRSLLITQHCS